MKIAGVVAGAEARPDHSRIVDRHPQTVVPQGISWDPIVAAEAVRRLLKVMLLGFKQLVDFPHCGFKAGVKNIGQLGFLPIRISQADHEAQGIDFEFALPNPRGHLRYVGRVPVPIVGRFVKRVGVRIDMHIVDMAFDQPADDPLQIGIVLGERHIMDHLLHGIAQPGGRDITGDDEGRSVVHQLRRCIQRVRETVLEQLQQFGAMRQFRFRFGQYVLDGLRQFQLRHRYFRESKLFHELVFSLLYRSFHFVSTNRVRGGWATGRVILHINGTLSC
ncbi:hypothetical protein D3C81_1257910 [compost metagenome]